MPRIPSGEGTIVGYMLNGQAYCMPCGTNRVRRNSADHSILRPATNRHGVTIDDAVEIRFELDTAPRPEVCSHCGRFFFSRGPQMPPRYNTATREHTETRECRSCNEILPLNESFFRHLPSGRWTRDCLNCRLDRTERDILEGRRPLVRWVTPLGRDRMFGVEIEFHGDTMLACDTLVDRGITCRVRPYTHEIHGQQWKITHDGSLAGSPDMAGELVSPPLANYARGESLIRTACAALESAGATVQEDCGMHVHHEASDMDVHSFGRLFRFYHTNQRLIDSFCDPSRWSVNHNTYSEPLNPNEIEWLEGMRARPRNQLLGILDNAGSRRRVLNAHSYARYGTIEFRQHHGVIDAEEIIAWARMTRAMVEWSNTDRLVPAPREPEGLLRALEAYGLGEASSGLLLAYAARIPVPPPAVAPLARAARRVTERDRAGRLLIVGQTQDGDDLHIGDYVRVQYGGDAGGRAETIAGVIAGPGRDGRAETEWTIMRDDGMRGGGYHGEWLLMPDDRATAELIMDRAAS